MTTARRSLAGLLAPIIMLFAYTAGAQELQLVSRQAAADGGAQANDTSGRPSISADGRFVAFNSVATNLIPGGDANGQDLDVFVRRLGPTPAGLDRIVMPWLILLLGDK